MSRVLERDDLLALALAALLVPATWAMVLGWSWPLSLAGHDELAHNLLVIRELVDSGGSWPQLAYRPDVLGGWKGRDAIGAFPLFSLLAMLGLGPVAVSTVSAFVIQACLGFLGMRAASDLAYLLGGRGLGLGARIATLWLCAFAPALGWRFGMGHLNLVTGLLAFAAETSLLLAACAASASATLVVVSVAAFVMAFSYTGQQTVLYGAFFGGPILVGVFRCFRREARALALPALVPLAGLLLALPSFWGMLSHAHGSDAPRQLGHESLTYDYVTATAADWATSLPWARASLEASGRAGQLHHEVNYPAGPLVVLLALLPWYRLRPLAVGLTVSLGLIMVFSMDAAPLSRLLIALVPPLGSFRVPARAVLPLLVTLPVLAAAAIGSRWRGEVAVAPVERAEESPRRKKKRRPVEPGAPARSGAAALLGAPGLLLVLLLPSVPREVVLWALAAAVAAIGLRTARALPGAVVLFVLGAGSVAAFRERLLPFQDPRSLFAEAERIGEALKRAKPELESPLSRAHLAFSLPAFAVNTALAARLSSLDGYTAPVRRFSRLLFALRGTRYEPTAVFFATGPENPAFAPLRQLYNVGWSARIESKGALRVEGLGATAGQAWFSADLERVDDVETLAGTLKEAGASLHSRLHQTVSVVASDPPVARAGLPLALDAGCADARVLRVDASRGDQGAKADVATPADCPLTFAMNYTEDLRAAAFFPDGRRQAAAVFPAYGALAAVLVPAGASTLDVYAEPPRLPWQRAWVGWGLALLAGATLLARRGDAPS